LDQAGQLRLTALFLNLFRLDAESCDTLSRPLTGLYPAIAGIGRKEGLDDDDDDDGRADVPPSEVAT